MIKKYWKLIVGAIAGIFGLIFLFSKKSNDKKLTETKKKIDSNNSNISKLDGKIEEVKKQKVVAKKKAATTKTKITETKELKKKPVPKKKKTTSKKTQVKSAAANIRKKTRK